MSTYAQFDEDGNQYQIASNLGWSEFGDWADTLDHKEFPNLVQYWEHGMCQDVKSIANELETALEKKKPAADVESTAELLLHALQSNQDAEMVLVTS